MATTPVIPIEHLKWRNPLEIIKSGMEIIAIMICRLPLTTRCRRRKIT
jgi:hypothetical protein